jgi:hypothetical protein
LCATAKAWSVRPLTHRPGRRGLVQRGRGVAFLALAALIIQTSRA